MWKPQMVPSLIMQTALLMGAVTAFVILDEVDLSNLLALMVTPLSPRRYLFFRLAAPALYTFVLSMVLYLDAQLDITYLEMAAASLLNSLTAPLFSLLVTALATNKVEGLTWVKGVNLIFILPMASFFMESGWAKALGIIPTYWIFHFNAMILRTPLEEEGGRGVGIYFFVAALFLTASIIALVRNFSHKRMGR